MKVKKEKYSDFYDIGYDALSAAGLSVVINSRNLETGAYGTVVPDGMVRDGWFNAKGEWEEEIDKGLVDVRYIHKDVVKAKLHNFMLWQRFPDVNEGETESQYVARTRKLYMTT